MLFRERDAKQKEWEEKKAAKEAAEKKETRRREKEKEQAGDGSGQVRCGHVSVAGFSVAGAWLGGSFVWEERIEGNAAVNRRGDCVAASGISQFFAIPPRGETAAPIHVAAATASTTAT